MSVSQVKNLFKEMADYLCKDTKGQEKLKKLKDAFNELRHGLADANARAEQAEQSKVAAVDLAMAGAAQSARASSMSELQSLRKKVANLTRNVADLNTVIESAAKEEEASYEADYEFVAGEEDTEVPVPSVEDDFESFTCMDSITPEIRAAIKALRKEMRFCPASASIIRYHGRPIPVFYREDLVSGWDHKSLWTLGASVAILASFGGVVAIATNTIFSKLKLPQYISGAELHLREWIVKNNDPEYKYSNASPKQLQDGAMEDSDLQG